MIKAAFKKHLSLEDNAKFATAKKQRTKEFRANLKSPYSLSAWVNAHFDPSDWGQKIYDAKIGEHRPNQHSNAAIERHVNRFTTNNQNRDALPALPKYLVEAGQLGIGPSIYAKPVRKCKSQPRMVLRFDLDTHHGEPDLAEAMRYLRVMFGDQLYVESSDRGASVWAVYNVPLYRLNNAEQTIVPEKKTRTNSTLDHLQSALQSIFKAHGIQTAIEIKGRLTITETADDGMKTIVKRGDAIKLPRCPAGLSDSTRLWKSVIHIDQIRRVIQSPQNRAHFQPVEPSLVQPSVDQCQVQPTPTKSKVTQKQKIKNTGDRHKNRVMCMREAMRQLKHRPGETNLHDDQMQQAIDLAEDIYVSHGLNTGARDSKRDAAFRGIAKWLTSTQLENQGDKGSGYWFDVDDIARAEEIIRSRISNDSLDSMNETNRKAMDGATISYFQLALAYCTMVKNRLTNGVEIPLSSVQGMFKSFGVTTSKPHASCCLKLLTCSNCIRCIDFSFYANKCRKWSVAPIAWSLPFVDGAKFEDDAVWGEGEVKPTDNNVQAGANDCCSQLSSSTLYAFLPKSIGRFAVPTDSTDPAESHSNWYSQPHVEPSYGEMWN